MDMSDLFRAIADLSGTDDVSLYRFEGHVTSGGHSHAVFADAESVTVVIRPWQDDMMQVAPEGQSGHTPGFKVYAPRSLGLSRDDRIEWNGGEFRLMNPQFDESDDLERWDMQTDERELRLLGDVPSGVEPTKPDDTFGEW